MARLEDEGLRIYTKTGDFGDTGLIGGGRVAKDSLRINAVGDLDELNAMVGACRAVVKDERLREQMVRVQSWLFGAGAEVATPVGSPISLHLVDAACVADLESWMDDQDAALEDLHHFILPGGTEAAARLHQARAVCRRAERLMWGLHREEPVRHELLMFLNRLSDWLFLTARTANSLEGVPDVIWSRPEDSSG